MQIVLQVRRQRILHLKIWSQIQFEMKSTNKIFRATLSGSLPPSDGPPFAGRGCSQLKQSHSIPLHSGQRQLPQCNRVIRHPKRMIFAILVQTRSSIFLILMSVSSCWTFTNISKRSWRIYLHQSRFSRGLMLMLVDAFDNDHFVRNFGTLAGPIWYPSYFPLSERAADRFWDRERGGYPDSFVGGVGHSQHGQWLLHEERLRSSVYIIHSFDSNKTIRLFQQPRQQFPICPGNEQRHCDWRVAARVSRP